MIAGLAVRRLGGGRRSGPGDRWLGCERAQLLLAGFRGGPRLFSAACRQRFVSWIEHHETLIIGVLAAVAILVGLIPRWTQPGAQSVWTDEQFSLSQTTGTLKNLRQAGHYEIHTPFFAAVLWIWNHIVSFGAARARAFSALATSLAILAVPLLLRRTPLAPTTRWVLTAAVATSGLGFVYGQEIRSYGLLWSLSVALTCSHIRINLAPTARDPL